MKEKGEEPERGEEKENSSRREQPSTADGDACEARVPIGRVCIKGDAEIECTGLARRLAAERPRITSRRKRLRQGRYQPKNRPPGHAPPGQAPARAPVASAPRKKLRTCSKSRHGLRVRKGGHTRAFTFNHLELDTPPRLIDA